MIINSEIIRTQLDLTDTASAKEELKITVSRKSDFKLLYEMLDFFFFFFLLV